MNKNLSSIEILGTTITTASENKILEYIFKRIEKRNDKFYIVTPNPEILTYALRHPLYRKILNDAEVSIPDGIGVLMAGKILQKKIIGRITGVDLMQKVCSEASKRTVTVGFLGGRGSIAEKTVDCLREKYPSLRVAFMNSEWDKARMTEKHIDILFVAFGFPKQEEWIARNLETIPVTCAMGVGGAFDYVSGKVPRAPKWIRNIGMEWVFRVAVQPWRIRRQLVLPQFVIEVLKEKISH